MAIVRTNVFGEISYTDRNQRFIELFDQLKKDRRIYNATDLSIKLEVDKSYISELRNNKRNLTEQFVDSLVSVFDDVSKDWLLTGEGSMLKEKKPKPFVSEVTPVPEDNYMMVEYADLRATAGYLGNGDVSVLPETQRRLLPREYAKGYYLVVRVDGDSMYDGSARSIRDGDEVLIREVTHELKDGLPIRKNLFIITTREGNVLKQIIEINQAERYLMCHSFNPSYSDYKIPLEDICQIFLVCKVVSKQITLE